MFPFLTYCIGDHCIDILFDAVQRCVVAPTYKKVKLFTLVEKRVKCIWTYVGDNWNRFDNCSIHPNAFGIHFVVIFSSNRAAELMLDGKYVYTVSEISDIPPWGML